MEIKNIKYIILNSLKKIPRIFKEIRKLPNVWLYIFLSLVLTFIFLIFTFPYGVLIRNGLKTIGENIGKSIYIGEIDFSLIKSTNIENMTITLKDGSDIALHNINLDIGIFSALLSNSVNGNVQINNIKYEKEKTSIDIVARSDFNLKFNSMSEFPAGGRIKLDFQNVIAKGITIQGFDIPPVRFSSIAGDLNILRNKINIGDCKVSGPDLKASIAGYLVLAKSFPQSQLNLNIIIDSSSSLLENYKILLSKWIDSSNRIQITVNGSISNPRIDALEQRNEISPRTEKRNTTPPGTDLSEKKNNKKPTVNIPPAKPQINPDTSSLERDYPPEELNDSGEEEE